MKSILHNSYILNFNIVMAHSQENLRENKELNPILIIMVIVNRNGNGYPCIGFLDIDTISAISPHYIYKSLSSY
jgi:hypothetical protein